MKQGTWPIHAETCKMGSGREHCSEGIKIVGRAVVSAPPKHYPDASGPITLDSDVGESCLTKADAPFHDGAGLAALDGEGSDEHSS